MNKLFRLVASWRLTAGLSILLAIALSGCAAPTPSQPLMAPAGVVTIDAGKSLAISATSPGAISYKWTLAGGGSIPVDTTAETVLYTAPAEGNTVAVLSVVASNPSGNSPATSLTITVLAAPTATPTEPPPTETPAPLPTSTSPLPPLVETFQQSHEGREFQYMNNNGVLIKKFVSAANDPDCVHSGSSGLKLTYQMSGTANGGWGVQWNEAPTGFFDASSFSAFTFWIKGEDGDETFQVGLKDTSGLEIKVEQSILSGWMEISIPLSQFEGVNTSSIENVNFGFNKDHGSSIICIDDIAFVP